MAQHNLERAKGAVVRVLADAESSLSVPEFVNQATASGCSQSDVLSVVHQMLDSGEVRFNEDMRLVSIKELA